MQALKGRNAKSTKTRIETQLVMCGEECNHVAMRNPLKQGLKHSYDFKIRPYPDGRNAKSTKTRIETILDLEAPKEILKSQCEIH